MEINKEEKIKSLLEAQYADVIPPENLKISIMRTIEFIKILKELGLLYTKGTMYLLKQLKTEGGE
ncbi:MAG: hypothetical protein U9R17_06285 [Thermodesulfobacteriota bacterium]|nr:hypothetical protein [Thermodesulfobacteriota bacterium]